MVAAAAAKKKSIPSSRLDKRPREETETVTGAPRPSKRVKKLAKKGERQIHVISSQTTGTTTPDVSPFAVHAPAVVQPAPAVQVLETRPESQTVVGPTTTPVVEEMAAQATAEPATARLVGGTSTPAPAEPATPLPVEEMAASEPVVARVSEEVTPSSKRTPSKTLKQSTIVLEVTPCGRFFPSFNIVFGNKSLNDLYSRMMKVTNLPPPPIFLLWMK